MTVTYKAQGSLTHPVNDLNAAREFLRECQRELPMASIVWADRNANVHSVTWDLRNEVAWEVTLVADEELPPAQLKLLSEWISGQNSDGLGEGFEQQPFAETEDEDHDPDDEYYVLMSSFDWETNPCTLEEVR